MIRAINKKSGGVSIIHIAPHSKLLKTMTEEEIFDYTMSQNEDIKGQPFIDIEKEKLPKSRIDRDKWNINFEEKKINES